MESTTALRSPGASSRRSGTHATVSQACPRRGPADGYGSGWIGLSCVGIVKLEAAA
jgi:hypothetical protein